MFKIRLLKSLDAVVGRLLCLLLPAPPSSFDRVEIERILLIRPGGIGDAVLLAPVLSVLRQRFPDATIDVLAEKRNAGAFQLVPDVEAVFRYDRPSEFLSLLRSSYDVVIDTEQWHRLSAVVTRLVPAKMRIGFGTNERKRMFSDAVSYSQDTYEAESFLHLLEPIMGSLTSAVLLHGDFLEIPKSIQVNAADVLRSLPGEKVVSLFPGASVKERQWGAERFSELAERLVDDGAAVVVVGGPEDKDLGDRIVGSLPKTLNLAGSCSLVESAAIINCSRLLVSGDSGVLHIGVGVGTPTVSLFGPGIARKWAPRGGRHIVINKDLDCSPCTRFGYTPKCPIDSACLKKISVNEVFDSIQELLGRGGETG